MRTARPSAAQAEGAPSLFGALICLFNPIVWWLYSADFSISFIPQSIILNPLLSQSEKPLIPTGLSASEQMYSDQLYTVSMDV